MVARGEGYGHGDALAGRRINLEFVSANPTGPLHAGGGRWVAVGDAMANLLAAQGAVVHREYYLNDAGNQLDTFAASLFARYRGEEPPEDGYQGAVPRRHGRAMRAELGDDGHRGAGAGVGLPRTTSRTLHDDLARIGVHFDTWFSERTLHEARRRQPRCSTTSASAGVVFEHDGATWLRTTDFGDQRDRVLVKSDGSTTYLCNDLAYHRDKFERGLGAPHRHLGRRPPRQVKSLQSGMAALGLPRRRARGRCSVSW